MYVHLRSGGGDTEPEPSDEDNYCDFIMEYPSSRAVPISIEDGSYWLIVKSSNVIEAPVWSEVFHANITSTLFAVCPSF